MAIQKRNIRGLQDIPTLSGRVDQTFLPYKAYMKMACLEMEKARRGKERESASYRVKNIDARVEKIKAALLQAQAELDKRRPTDARDSGPKAEPPPPRSASGFRLRY